MFGSVNPQDVIIIGRLFSRGILDTSIIITFCGSEVNFARLLPNKKRRFGKCICPYECESRAVAFHQRKCTYRLHALSPRVTPWLYHNSLRFIPEGNYHEFFGWALPGLNKFSFSKSFFTYLTPNRQYRLNTNYNGGKARLCDHRDVRKGFSDGYLCS